jgi:hypothetical protein
VPGSIDDVDFYIFVPDRHILAQNGDPPFPFQLIAVKDKFPDLLVVTKKLYLIQYAVDKGGFAMVYMGDDGDISDFFHLFLNWGAKV